MGIVHLRKFYVVTQLFLYEVLKGTAEGLPLIEKLAARCKSDFGPGQNVSGMPFVGVMKMSVFLYAPKMPQMIDGRIQPTPPEKIGLQRRTFRTTEVVGLFLDKVEAGQCFYQGDPPFVTPDPRWREPTEEVLTCIGPNHPRFILTADPYYQLWPESDSANALAAQ